MLLASCIRPRGASVTFRHELLLLLIFVGFYFGNVYAYHFSLPESIHMRLQLWLSCMHPSHITVIQKAVLSLEHNDTPKVTDMIKL